MRGDKVFVFWSKYNPEVDIDFETWRNRPIKLNPSHALSLQSHAKFGHEVHLYTYQPLDNELPVGVTKYDANIIFTAELAYEALARGHSIAHVSDLVRLRSASETGGLVLDMDGIVINELPDVPGFFCTMPAKATGGVAPKWGKATPPFTVHDGSWDGKALSAFPVKVSDATKQQIHQLSVRIEQTLAQPPKTDTKAWNFVMWALKDMSREHPDHKVFPPIKTCPVPSWLGAGKCYSTESPTRLNGVEQVFGYTLPTIEQIFEESYIVQHFFESAWQNYDQNQTAASFWYDIPADSLLGLIAQQTVGDKWRTMLPLLIRK